MDEIFMDTQDLPNSGIYSLKWNNFQTHLSKGFNKLLEDDDFTDVTLACDGNCLRSNKLLLSLCSPFFKRIFKANRMTNVNTVIILNNVRFEDLHNIISFIYNGQVNIKHTELTSFLQAAELLQIEGLAGSSNVNDSQGQESHRQSQAADVGGAFTTSTSTSNASLQFSSSSHHESALITTPKPAKRPKVTHNSVALPSTSSTANMQSVLNTQSYQRQQGFNVNAAPSVTSRTAEPELEIITKIDDTDEVEVIDPLRDDSVNLHNEGPIINMTERIYPEEKSVEEEEPIFLDRMNSGIRIEGIYSSHPTPNSIHLPSTSTTSSGQPKPQPRYSVSINVEDENVRNQLQMETPMFRQHSLPSNSSPLMRARSIDSPPSDGLKLNKNSGDEDYCCVICRHQCTGYANLLDHMTNEHSEEAVECPICGRQYKNKNSLKVHKSIYHRGHSSTSSNDNSADIVL